MAQELLRGSLVHRPFPLLSFAAGLFLSQFSPASAAKVVPCDFRDGLIWLKVKSSAAGKPLNFILDSGADVSVLSLATARRLRLAIAPAARVLRVDGAAPAHRVSGFHADVAGIPVGETPLALDLSETSRACSRPIDGLLGGDFFLGRVIQIDYKAQCIRLLERADAGENCTALPLKMERRAMCVHVSVDGSRPRWTRLDTGCDDGLHWVSRGGRGYIRSTVALGGEQIPNVKTALHGTEIFPGEAGLLGNGILSNYRVTIDAVNRMLFLERT